jgi:hypothetical protein
MCQRDEKMGMTIEDYINIIKNWLYKGTDGLTNTRLGYMEGWFHKADKEAFETAITTMYKYQKIEQLVKFYKNAGEIPIFVLEGVLKDGNDD